MHAATALPTFTLSGSPISHSMKYALKIHKQFMQVARECSKESFTIPKSLISSSTSPIHLFQKFNSCQQFGNCAMNLRKETYLGPQSLNFSCLKPENESTPYQTVNLQVSHTFSVFYVATLQHHKVNKKKLKMSSPVSFWLLGLVRLSYPF